MEETHDDNIISTDTYEHWCKWFTNGDFDLSDKKHGGKLPDLQTDELLLL